MRKSLGGMLCASRWWLIWSWAISGFDVVDMMARFGVPDAIPVALRRAMRKAKSSVRRRAGFLWNSRTWKLLLVPTVLMMAADLVLFSGHGADAVTVAKNLSKANLVVALTDPMSLLDARSPGGRGVGPLQQSKPGERASNRLIG